jgi:hypothetical protein
MEQYEELQSDYIDLLRKIKTLIAKYENWFETQEIKYDKQYRVMEGIDECMEYLKYLRETQVIALLKESQKLQK